MAAQSLNTYPEQPIYGIVTDAEVWQFVRLTEKIFTHNLSRALIDDIASIFGAIYRLMELATEQTTDKASSTKHNTLER